MLFTPSETEPVTFWLVALSLNQLRHCAPHGVEYVADRIVYCKLVISFTFVNI
jgi:hypothetical protein